MCIVNVIHIKSQAIVIFVFFCCVEWGYCFITVANEPKPTIPKPIWSVLLRMLIQMFPFLANTITTGKVVFKYVKNVGAFCNFFQFVPVTWAFLPRKPHCHKIFTIFAIFTMSFAVMHKRIPTMMQNFCFYYNKRHQLQIHEFIWLKNWKIVERFNRFLVQS